VRASARADAIAAAGGVAATIEGIGAIACHQENQADLISLGAPAALRRLASRAAATADAARARALAADIEAGTAGQRGAQAPAGGMPPGCPIS
jgi:hypothetical protein